MCAWERVVTMDCHNYSEDLKLRRSVPFCGLGWCTAFLEGSGHEFEFLLCHLGIVWPCANIYVCACMRACVWVLQSCEISSGL